MQPIALQKDIRLLAIVDGLGNKARAGAELFDGASK